MIWLAIQLLGSGFMILTGILVLRRSLPLATAFVASQLSLILLKAAVVHIPAAEPRLFPWDWYPYVESWWYLFPAMGIFGVGIVLVRKSVWKRDGLLAGAGYLLIQSGVIAVLIERPKDLSGVVNTEGICLQSTGYSCAPASAVMLLHRVGVESTEKEMAQLCVTRAGGSSLSGTSDAGVMRGLRLKLMGRGKPVISAPDYDQLRAPALVMIQLNPRLGHCILISGVEPDQLRVIDPLYGKGTIPRVQFERQWCGSAIHLEPR
jgi:hypothetical protein